METLPSGYSDVSFNATAHTIHLSTTTDSGIALGFRAAGHRSTAPARFRPGLYVNFLFRDDPPGRGGFRSYFFHDIALFRLQRDVARREVDAILASAGVPSACAPAVEFFCAFTSGVAAAELWRGAAVTVTVPASALDLGVETVRYGGSAAACVVREEACGICFDEFVDGAEIGRLQCSHAYHEKCLRQWLYRKRSCPYCRAPARSA